MTLLLLAFAVAVAIVVVTTADTCAFSTFPHPYSPPSTYSFLFQCRYWCFCSFECYDSYCYRQFYRSVQRRLLVSLTLFCIIVSQSFPCDSVFFVYLSVYRPVSMCLPLSTDRSILLTNTISITSHVTLTSTSHLSFIPLSPGKKKACIHIYGRR